MDGGLSGAARFFHRPAACSSQCVQPAYGADGAHRAGGTGAYPYRGPCGGRALYAGVGSYRRQRSGVGAVHAGLLPAGCPQCLCGAKAVRPADPARRLWEILWPVEGGRVLASALHTAENMLVPACLAVYLINAGGRTAALEQYGELKGMALPLLTFPFGLLGSLSVLLMPEITQAHILGQTERLNALLNRMLRLTGYFSALAGVLFWVWGRPLAQLLYQSADAGFYLETLAPAMPLMYLESMVDGAMKGVGEQKAAFRYSVWDSILRIGGVVALLPRFGMKGFLAVILLSSLYTCAANTGHLLFSSGTQHAFRRWLGAPALAAVLAAAAGMALRKLLADGFAARLPLQLAALGVGGCATTGVFLLAAWPLGLGEEAAALWAAHRPGRPKK